MIFALWGIYNLIVIIEFSNALLCHRCTGKMPASTHLEIRKYWNIISEQVHGVDLDSLCDNKEDLGNEIIDAGVDTNPNCQRCFYLEIIIKSIENKVSNQKASVKLRKKS